MRRIAFFVSFFLVLVGCGGSTPTVSDARDAADAPRELAYVPASADVIVRIDLDRMRADPRLADRIAVLAALEAGMQVLFDSTATMWFASDTDRDEKTYVLMIVPTPGESARVLASVDEGRVDDETSVFVSADGVIVFASGAMRSEVEARVRRHASLVPLARSAARHLQSWSPGNFMMGVFVPSAESRRAFYESSEGDVRDLLQTIAEGTREIRFESRVESSAVEAIVDFDVADEGVGEVLTMVLDEASQAAEVRETDELGERLAQRWFSLITITASADVIRTTADLTALLEESDAEPVGEQAVGDSGRAAPVDPVRDAARRGDHAFVVDALWERRATLLGEISGLDLPLVYYSQLCESLVRIGRLADATTALDALDARRASNPELVPATFGTSLLYLRARILSSRGDHAASIAAFDAALALDPSEVQRTSLRNGRAFEMADTGLRAESLAYMRETLALEHARSLSPEELLGLDEEQLTTWQSQQNNLAWLHHLNGDDALAWEVIRPVIEAEATPSLRYAHFFDTAAEALYGLARFDECAAMHRSVLDLLAAQESLVALRALTLLKLSRVEAALQHTDKSVLYARRGLELAERSFAETHPSVALAHLRVAQAMALAGEPGVHAEAARAVALFAAFAVPTHPERVEAEAFLRAHRR